MRIEQRGWRQKEWETALTKMTPLELMEHVESVAREISNLKTGRPKRPPKPKRPLTPEEIRFKEAATRDRLEDGKIRIKALAQQFGMTPQRCNALVTLLNKRKELPQSAGRGPSKKKPLREADENHPWVKDNAGIARTLVNKYQAAGETWGLPRAHLEGEALKALIHATAHFDKSRAEFSTFAYNTVKGFLKRTISREKAKREKLREISTETGVRDAEDKKNRRSPQKR